MCTYVIYMFLYIPYIHTYEQTERIDRLKSVLEEIVSED